MSKGNWDLSYLLAGASRKCALQLEHGAGDLVAECSMPFLVVHGPGSRRGMMLLPAMMGSGGLGGVMLAVLAAAEDASTAGGGGASSAGRHFDSVSSSYTILLSYIGAGVCSNRGFVFV